MERRAAGALLALAACLACTAAAPTASNQTTLDFYDGAPEGCYYNFQHYGEGDRIMTNEPCLNCTCHNRMLMCYLRVCPFTKPIGQDCTVEKRADQCCPIVTCPDVPVDLLTSTSTTSPDEYGGTGVGKLDKYGCSINGKYLPEGAKVPSSPDKPCEHCYCFRNVTNCIMQECTLHVDGCTPIYHRDACCPVRYSCDHPEDETLMLDDMTTTVRPTPGFLLTTTTSSPVTQMSQDCVHDDQIFADGALIKTEKACEHCYCMKGDIVCVVQECGTPMENEGKNCSSLPPREGQCCPDTYICEGDEPSTEIMTETTKESIPTETSTLLPPKRTSIEGSGYRNEPDDTSSLGFSTLEPTIEGSGDEFATAKPIDSDGHIKPQVFDENIVTDDSLLHSSSTPLIDLMEETTEPDKGLNTVPLSEDDIIKPLVPARTTLSHRETEAGFTTSSLTTEKLETHLGTTTDQVFTTASSIIDDKTINNAETISIDEQDLSTPIYDDKNTHEQEMSHPTTPSKIGDDEKQESFTTPYAGINYEETTINKIDDGKMDGGVMDDENIQSEISTVGIFDKVTEEEENKTPEQTTMSISTSKDESEIGDATTANIMSTIKEDAHEIHSEITTASVLDSDKSDDKPIEREPSIVMLDDTKKDEENNKYGPTTEIFSEDNTPNILDEVNKNQDIDSESVTKSSDDVEKEEISPSETTISSALDDVVKDSEMERPSYTTPSNLDYTIVSAQESLKTDDRDVQSEITTIQSIDKEILQTQSTTISASNNAMEDEKNTQSETTTKGTMDIFKDGEKEILSEVTTARVGDVVKSDDKVSQPDDINVSTVHDTNVENEPFEPSTISYLESNTKEDIKPLSEITTISSLDEAKEHEESQPESTTKGISDEAKPDEEKTQTEITTSSDLETMQGGDEEKHKLDATTESAIDDDDKKDGDITKSEATTVAALDVVKEDQPDETTVSSMGNIKKDEEVIKSESTTISSFGPEKEKEEDTKPEDTPIDVSDDSISKDKSEVTTVSVNADKDNVTDEATTPKILEGLEIDEDKKQTMFTTSSSDIKQTDDVTTVRIMEHDKIDEEKINSETSTTSTINDISEEKESTLTEATTMNILEKVSEIENNKEDETTTVMSSIKEIGGTEQLETTITSAINDTEKDSLPSTVSILDQKDEENIYHQSTTETYITRSDQTTSDFSSSEVSSTVASKKIDTTESLTTEKALKPETVTEVSDITESTSDSHKLSTHTEPLKETMSHTTEFIESSETSSINPIENEIDEDASPLLPPGRIPGEGDCLLNGITYNNESSVPSSNKCQSNCRCFSSIIKCDPIICSQPPDNMENCQPMYDSEDSCCPSYVCDQNKETIPPQSHSQMSGTESPIQTTNKICDEEKCHSEDEEILKEPAVSSEMPELCTGTECAHPQPGQNVQSCSGIECEQSQPSQPTDIPHSCQGNECKQGAQDKQPCVGEKCDAEKPVSCEKGDCSPVDTACNGNECQQIPVNVECNGDTCESTSDEPHQQDTVPILPSCEDDTCGIKKTPPVTVEDNTCSDENGCKASDDNVQVDCTSDSCRRVEVSETEHKVSDECSGDDCVQKETHTNNQDTRINTEINVTPKVQEATTDMYYTMTDKNLEEPQHEYPTKSDSSDKNDNLPESHLTTPKMDENIQTVAEELTTLAGLPVTESSETSSTMRIRDLPTIITESPVIEQVGEQTDQPKIPAEEESDSNIKDSQDNAQDVTIEPQKDIEETTTLSNVYDDNEKPTESSLSSQPNDVRTTIHDTIDTMRPSYQTTLQEMIHTTPQPDLPNQGSIETSTLTKISEDQEKISTISDLKIDITTSSTESPERKTTEPLSFDNSVNNVEIDTEEPNVMITDLSESEIDLKTTSVPISIKHQEHPMLPTTEAEIITETYPITQKQPVSVYSETTESVITVSIDEKTGVTQEIHTTISDFSKIDDTTTHSTLVSEIELTDITPINENEVSQDMPISTDRSTEIKSEQDSQNIPSTVLPPTKDHEITTDNKILTDEMNLHTFEEQALSTPAVESSTQTLTDVETSLFDEKQKETTLAQQEMTSQAPDMTNEFENRLTTEKTSDILLPELTEVSEIAPELTTSGPQETYPGEEEEKDTKMDQPILTTISPEYVMKDKESSTPSESETIHTEDDTVTTEKTINKVFETTTEKASDLLIPTDLITNAPDSYNTVPDESGETTLYFTQEKSTPTEIMTEATTPSLIIERSSETTSLEKDTTDAESKIPDASDISDAGHTTISPEAFETPVTEIVVVDTNLPQDIVKESERPQEESTINPPVTDSNLSLEKITTLSPELLVTSSDKESEPMDVQQEILTGKPPIVETSKVSKTTIDPDYSIKNEFDSDSTKTPETVTENKKIDESSVFTSEETTPYLVELEEHTHKIIDELSTAPSPLYDELTTVRGPSDTEFEYDPTKHNFEAGEVTTESDQKTAIPIDESNSEIITSSPKNEESFEKSTEKMYTTTKDSSDTELGSKFGTETTQIDDKNIESIDTTIITPSKNTESPTILEHTEKDQTQENVTPVTSDMSASGEEFLTTVPKATTKPDEVSENVTKTNDIPIEATTPAAALETQKPHVGTDELPSPDYEAPAPSSGTSGYGQEPDYVEEDQAFGPGTCRYGGKVYVSAQQIPRDDPCDFCFCFRSDIICLQQSCPPPIQGCHEEPIQGFCCPRYECPVAMATTLNMTTTTTTTTTTLPPHFPTHAYSGAAQRRGCQIKGHIYKVGEVVNASSGPCLHCTCGGDGQMKCDPKVCTPEPMLRQMIAAAVSAKRRR